MRGRRLRVSQPHPTSAEHEIIKLKNNAQTILKNRRNILLRVQFIFALHYFGKKYNFDLLQAVVGWKIPSEEFIS